MKTLLSERRLPMESWDDSSIEFILNQLSIMDSNNFRSNCGLGEREGRIYSSLVHRRHYGFAHGIGRSGDISEVQPKAVGSSIIYKLVNHMLLHALHICGLTALQKCLLVPLATGMTLALCMQQLKKPCSKYVIWSRIDQKSCFKAISAAGLVPLVVETVLVGDELETDVGAIRNLLRQYGSEVACVLSTTSCFTPRCPDKIDEIALLCEEYGVGHVVNNAYGMQCARISRLITRAISIGGRIDYVIQSCDKNLMVPVGGAIIASPTKKHISEVAKLYPGRASAAPVLDVFITLLSMGESGYRRLLEERNRLFPVLLDGIFKVAKNYGERLLLVPRNSISFGLTLKSVISSSKDTTFFGSLLFQRSVSGARVINPDNSGKTINGTVFESFGAHYNGYPEVYMTAACAVGLTENEITVFLTRLSRCFAEYKKKYSIPQSPSISSETVRGSISTENPDSSVNTSGHLKLNEDCCSASCEGHPSLLWLQAYAPKPRKKKIKKVSTDDIDTRK